MTKLEMKNMKNDKWKMIQPAGSVFRATRAENLQNLTSVVYQGASA